LEYRIGPPIEGRSKGGGLKALCDLVK